MGKEVTAGPSGSRRPMKTRQRAWARALAGRLASRHVTPNSISLGGVASAVLGGGCLAAVPHVDRVAQVTLLALAAGLIAARLLANMLDGLVAVEFGQRSPIGELFNEVPDRVSDVFLLVGAGYALSLGTWATVLGWMCALLAVGTAYVRLLGGALGFPQDFSGPMAKPQRMATLIVGCLLSIVEVPLGYAGRVIAATLIVIALGSCVTLVRRTTVIAGKLVRT